MKTTLFITKAMLFLFLISAQAQQTHNINWGMSTTNQQASITIDVGDTIKWIWVDNGMPHDVSSIDPNAPEGFGSPLMSTLGYEYSFTFDSEVTFNYRCAVHPGTMFGTITVVGGTVEEVVNIPDAAFKAYLVGNASINLNSDSEIQVSEAEAFTGTINCTTLGIADLTGIEAFTGITGLNCSNNNITALNLNGNTLLTELYCNGNALKSLDVSNLSALMTLDCSDNDISALNLSSNIALTDIYCTDLHLTDLDLSANPNLTTIDCSQNHMLSSLNVQNGNNMNVVFFSALGNTELTCIKVDDADYSTANWTNIEDGTMFSETCSVSVGEFTKSQFAVYPNPVENMFTIESLTPIQAYRIFDLQGKELAENSTNTQNLLLNVDITTLDSGIYFIEVSSTKQQTVIFKIIKK
jgi:Leucine-rich repeat (LRR) protein